MNTAGLLASGIWEDLDEPQNPSVTFISGWLSSDRSLGKLNLLLGTHFIVDTTGAYSGQYFNAGGYSGQYVPGDFYPAFGNTEIAVYSELYKQDYYDRKIRDALNGILGPDGTTIDWQELSEGDTTIRRSNRNEVVKTYRNLQLDSRLELQKLVGYYRQNLSLPLQVAGDDADNDVSIPFRWNNYYRRQY